MAHGIVASSLKIFLVDLVGRTLFWPIWWYTLGLKLLLSALATNILEEERRIGVTLWWRNVLVPMYGQSDWQGRIISFIMRLAVGSFRTALWLLWFALSLAVVTVWVFGPPAASYLLWRNFLYLFDVG